VPKLDSTRYTFVFAAIVCVVCALLIAVSAVGLRERQEANAQLYRQKNVLFAAGLATPDDALSERELQRIFTERIQYSYNGHPPCKFRYQAKLDEIIRLGLRHCLIILLRFLADYLFTESYRGLRYPMLYHFFQPVECTAAYK
jgi:hypothetical protein